MKKKHILPLAVLLAAAACAILLLVLKQGKLKAYYIYNNPCASCREYETFAETFQTALGEEAENCEVVRVYLLNNDGHETYQALCRKLNIPERDRTPPMLVIGNQYISGTDNIARNGPSLYDAAKSGTQYAPPE